LKNSYPSLRYITNSGGRMPETVTRQVRQSHPAVDIYLMYGLTEAFRSTYLPPYQVDTRPTSMGKAIPNVEILVVNDNGEPCRPGEVGELVHRGATISLGYWRDPDATARVFRPHPLAATPGGREEVVVYSGDYVKMDEEGYLYYIGRKDAQLKSHGMRVSPEEVEEYLYSSKLVAHAVVFGATGEDGETRIVAAIVPLDHASFEQEILRRFCKELLPDYLIPQAFWVRSGFPQTSSGKPDRVKIREDYLQSLVQD
jgi:acyl-CoA synthetase (AMP-forming)/AMP-acid ligase II